MAKDTSSNNGKPEIGKSTQVAKKMAKFPILIDIVRGIFNCFYAFLMCLFIYILFFCLFFPETIVLQVEEYTGHSFTGKDTNNITGENPAIVIPFILSIFFSGALGGLIKSVFKYFLSHDKLTDDDNWEYVKFWKIILSVIVSGVISVLSFFLIKAGLIKRPSVDVFNSYGAAGVSFLIGLFSIEILKKITELFKKHIE